MRSDLRFVNARLRTAAGATALLRTELAGRLRWRGWNYGLRPRCRHKLTRRGQPSSGSRPGESSKQEARQREPR
jgi:hypothetical protein